MASKQRLERRVSASQGVRSSELPLQELWSANQGFFCWTRPLAPLTLKVSTRFKKLSMS